MPTKAFNKTSGNLLTLTPLDIQKAYVINKGFLYTSSHICRNPFFAVLSIFFELIALAVESVKNILFACFLLKFVICSGTEPGM